MRQPTTSDELEALQEQWHREVQVRIQTAQLARSSAPDILEVFDDALLAVDSGRRLALLLDLVRRRPSRIFWPVFLEWWSDCDVTWIWRHHLLRYFRRHHARNPGSNYLQGDDRTFFDSLPDPIEVCSAAAHGRGCGVSLGPLPAMSRPGSPEDTAASLCQTR